MAFSRIENEHVTTLNRVSFRLCDNGEVARRAFICNQLEAKTSGLTIGGRISEVTLSPSTWTPLPATPLPDRNSLNIQNTSGVDIKINYSDSVSGFVGVLLGGTAERHYDITDNIVIYAKSQTGTPTITVEEIA